MLPYACALLATRRYLRGILRPLEAIEQAALAIGRREFGEVHLQTGARELQRVGIAMNDLAAKVRHAIEEESIRANRLYKEAFEDPLSGVLNRRGLFQRVQGLLAEGTQVPSGALVFVSLIGLEEINRSLGSVKGDELIQQLSEVVRAVQAGEGARAAQAGEPPIVGRWQGASFAVLLPNQTLAAAQAWADAACRGFASLLSQQSFSAETSVAAGLVHFDAQRPAWLDLEREAGEALSEAMQRNEPVCVSRSLIVGGAAARSADEWRQRIEAALAGGGLALYAQRVFALPGRAVLHAEITSRLLEPDGRVVAAAAFVPAASRHHLLPLIDRALLNRLWPLLEKGGALLRSVAVNISTQSMADTAFRSELRARLERAPGIARRIVFEVGGYAAVHSDELAALFAAEVRATGARFALDGFGLTDRSLRLVHHLLP